MPAVARLVYPSWAPMCRALPIASLLVLAAPASAQDPAADARAAFERGMREFAAERFEDALLAFRQAYAIRPHAAVLVNIASSLDRLGRTVEAFVEYQRYLRARGPEIEPARRQAVEEALRRLRPLVSFIQITPPAPGLPAAVDGRVVDLGEGAAVVEPGPHVVESGSRQTGFVRQQVVVIAGETRDVVLVFPSPEITGASSTGAGRRDRPPPEQSWGTSWRWVGLAATLVLGASLAYTASRAISLSNQYEEDPDPAIRDEGLTYRAVSEFVFIPATALALGFTIVAFVSASAGAEEEEPEETAFLLLPVPGGVRLGAWGTF